jgi:PAS domain S-box-containing protein
LDFVGLFEHAPTGALLVDAVGVLHLANESARSMLGLSSMQRGRTTFWPAHVAPNHLARFYRFIRDVVDSEGSITVELQLRHMQEGSFWARLDGRRVKAAGVHRGVLISFVDISEGKRAEERCSRSEGRLRAVVESMPDAINNPLGHVMMSLDELLLACERDASGSGIETERARATRDLAASALAGIRRVARVVAELGMFVRDDEVTAPIEVGVPAVNPPPIRMIPRPDPAGPRRKQRFLVIDDEELIRQALAFSLSALGEVAALDSIDDAIDLLERGDDPDVIVCDIFLPGRTGADLHEWVSQRRPELLPRMVFITGGACTPATREFLRRAATPVLHKPFSLREFRAFLQPYLPVGREIEATGVRPSSSAANDR